MPRPGQGRGAPGQAYGSRRPGADGAPGSGPADPTRLDLAFSLQGGGELCVCDLAWISGRSKNLVSHHLRALKAAELADSRRDGKVVFYRLTTAGDRLLSEALVATGHEMVTKVEGL